MMDGWHGPTFILSWPRSKDKMTKIKSGSVKKTPVTDGQKIIIKITWGENKKLKEKTPKKTINKWTKHKLTNKTKTYAAIIFFHIWQENWWKFVNYTKRLQKLMIFVINSE